MAAATVSPRLHLYAARTSSEAEIRSLAAALVAARKTYLAIVNTPKAGLSDEQLADLAIAEVGAARALGAASLALDGAV